MDTYTYADLMAASGKLTRAAEYLLYSVATSPECPVHVFQAMGTLYGIAHTVRPQVIK